jgi:hypothetical protein
MSESMKEIRQKLWKPGAVQRAAEIAYGLLNEDRRSCSVAEKV